MREFTKKLLWEGKFLRIFGKEFVNQNGTRGIWECVERTKCTGIVAVFAVTKDKEVILAKQFRFPAEAYNVELPAGVLDKEGESPEDAAGRELQEETGYRADKLIYVHGGLFNAGMTDNEISIYYAPDVEFMGFDGVLSDDSEEIEVIKVPLGELVDFCTREHEGFKVDLKILGTLKVLEARGLI